MSVRFEMDEMINMSDMIAAIAKLPAELKREFWERELTPDEIESMAFSETGGLSPSDMRSRIEEDLAAKKDEGMLGEALTLAINNGNNLDRLRQKLAHNKKQLARVNDIIETMRLRSKTKSKELPTLSRLLLCYPVDAFHLAHQMRPKLRRGSRTPEAFPHAMRQQGFGALIPRGMHELYHAYCLYKAQSSGKPVDKASLQEMSHHVWRAREGRSDLSDSEARERDVPRWELIMDPQYGIFTADGELVEVLKRMAAKYQAIMQPE